MGAQPKFCKARPVPYPLKPAVEDEYNRFEAEGIIERVEYTSSYVWWPKIDSVIEETVRSRPQCSNNRTAPPAASLHPWTWLSIPWQRLHVNFATYEGNHYLIVVDAHSKWPEVLGPMRTTNAEATINALRTLFARYGTLSETEGHTASVGVTISSIFKWTD